MFSHHGFKNRTLLFPHEELICVPHGFWLEPAQAIERRAASVFSTSSGVFWMPNATRAYGTA
jgi:hypothetical protein